MTECQHARNKPGLGARTTAGMHDPCGVRTLAEDLLGCEHVAHRAERIGRTVGHHIRPASHLTQFVSDGMQAAITILIPRNVVDDRAIKSIQQDVAGVLVARLGNGEPAAHDAEVAFDADTGTGRGDLTCRVRLHHAAAHNAVGVHLLRVGKIEFELPDLVAAKTKTGAVITLHPQRVEPKQRAKPPHRFERRGQVSQGQSRQVPQSCERISHGE